MRESSPVTERRGVCPKCQNPVQMSKLVFRKGFRCPRCGVALHVSRTYSRVLVLLSGLIGVILVWGARVREVVPLCLFWLPTAFLVGTVMVRVAPFFFAPLFVLRDEPITTLGLTDGSEDPDRD